MDPMDYCATKLTLSPPSVLVRTLTNKGVMGSLSPPSSSKKPASMMNKDSSFCISGSSQSSGAAHDQIQETSDGGKKSIRLFGYTIIVDDGASGSWLLGPHNPIPPLRLPNNPIPAVPLPNQRYVKALTKSDVDSCCRLMIKKSFVTRYLLPFMNDVEKGQVHSDDGYNVRVYDIDTRSEHVVNFKYWYRSSQSYVFTYWSQPFVKRRSLRMGDTISLSWDGRRFYFCVLRRVQQLHQS